MARNLETVHAKAKSYDWQFTVGDQRPKFPTRYTIPATGKDPFRMLIRDYVKMEAEKDDRTHGFLDGVLRMGIAEQVQPRFMECMKLTLPVLTFAEFAAVENVSRARPVGTSMIRYDQKSGIRPVVTSRTLNAAAVLSRSVIVGRARRAAISAPVSEPTASTADARPNRPAPVWNTWRDISALVTWKFMPKVATKKISTMVIHSAGRSLT